MGCSLVKDIAKRHGVNAVRNAIADMWGAADAAVAAAVEEKFRRASTRPPRSSTTTASASIVACRLR